ncbi:hypothetical protein AYI70_g6035 [Smittium culicis]|uniref:CCHC-type domain-containing protein n=1 Tax=Smittium culicis TaxID=133412 RepID=A0A1R1XRU9_9FUNG|nr:hypothetical protein AYI70_g6035 [Smittium culicis]
MSHMTESLEDLDAPVTMTLRDYNELRHMATTVTELQALIDNLRSSENNPKAIIHTREPHVSDPEHFYGNREHLRNFTSQDKLVIQAQPSRFPTERQKVIFAATFLRGMAFSWLQPHLESNIPVLMLDNLEIFFEESDTYPQSMEIEGTNTRRTLTPEEKQRRRDNKLCLYCGNPGHIVKTCPLREQTQGARLGLELPSPVFKSDSDSPAVTDSDYPATLVFNYPAISDSDYPANSDSDYPANSDSDPPIIPDSDPPDIPDSDYSVISAASPNSSFTTPSNTVTSMIPPPALSGFNSPLIDKYPSNKENGLHLNKFNPEDHLIPEQPAHLLTPNLQLTIIYL